MHRSWSGWIASAALLVAGSVPPSWAEPPPARVGPPPWDSAEVEALARAHAAGDEAEMTRIVRARDADSVALAYGLWVRRLGEPRTDGTQPPAAAEAARQVARLSEHGPEPAAFEALVAAWAALTGEALAAERALARAFGPNAVKPPADLPPAPPQSLPMAMARWNRARRSEKANAPEPEIDAGYAGAVKAMHAVPWPEQEAYILDAWRERKLRAGRYDDALRHIDAAVALGARAVSPLHRALLLASRAEVTKRLGRYEEALADGQKARELLLALGDRAHAAEMLGSLALIRYGQRRDAEADALATQAREEALAAQNPNAAARALLTRGFVALRQGRPSAGLAYYEQALAEAEPLGDEALLARVLGSLGVLEATLQYVDRAMDHLERSRVLHERRGDRVGALRASGRMTEVQLADGRLEAALASSRRARGEARALGLWNLEHNAWDHSGDALLMLGRFEEALVCFDEMAAWHRGAKRLPEAAVADERAAYALQRLGRSTEALARVQGSVSVLEAAGMPLQAARGHTTWGLALHYVGRHAEALLHFGTTLEVERRAAGGFGETATEVRHSSAREVADFAVATALDLAKGGNEAEAADAAFGFLETVRASLLAEALTNREALLSARLPPALLAAERESRERVQTALREPAVRAPADGRNRLDEAYRRREEVLARIGTEARSSLALLEPPRLTLRAFRAQLQPGEAFVAYHLDNMRLAALVATPERAALVHLGPAADLSQRVGAWSDLLSAPGSKDTALSGALYDRLLRPLEPHLLGVRRLLVSPDGVLAFAPFSALQRVQPEGASTRLAEVYEVAMIPSATTLVLLRREAKEAGEGRGAVVVGDPAPAPGAAPLPGSAEEARLVGALHPEDARTVLVGPAATVAALRDALARAPGRLATLHVAAHGVFDAEHPRLSGLVLAGGERLDFDEVSGWRIPVDLTVLSGCETARGRLRLGEGLLGLPRPFFVAGCPRVVVSAWRVADRSTPAFMSAFHEGLVRRGLAPGAALRQAQMAALADPARAHPFHWAAFALWGLPD